MRPKFVITVVLLCLALVPAAYAQEPAPTAGPVVGLSLIVTDKDGKGVNSIRKDQLRVFENKVEQTVIGIEPDERPVDYVVLVDSTGSFNKWFESALEVTKLLIVNRRPQDQVAIIRFVNSDKIEKVQEFATDHYVLLKALDSLYIEEGQSAVIDALYLSAQYVAEHNKSNDGRRKALIVITDGEERISYYKVEDLLKLLYQESVQVFAIGLTADLSQKKKSNKFSPRESAETLLLAVAERTGGRVFFPETKEQIVLSAAEILLHLRAQFRIKYQSTTDASKTGFRDIEVKFVSSNGELRHLVTPRAYHVGPKTPPGKKSEKKKK